jgi:hypothetical protein
MEQQAACLKVFNSALRRLGFFSFTHPHAGRRGCGPANLFSREQKRQGSGQPHFQRAGATLAAISGNNFSFQAAPVRSEFFMDSRAPFFP